MATVKKDGGEHYIYNDKQFRTLIEQNADAIQLVTADGKVLYSSDAILTELGYDPDEIQNVNISPYLHPDDTPKFYKIWQKLLKKPRGRATLEYRVKHKSGEWVWIEATITNHIDTPGIKAMVGSFRNIAERKATEEKLRRSEEQYRLLTDLSPEAICVHSAGKIVYVNKAGAQLIGAKSTDELIGQPIARFVHPDYVELVKERIQVILTEDKPTPLVREKFIRMDGEIIDVEVISLPIFYDGKQAVQIVVRDITEQKRAIDALEESEQRLRFMAESMPQKIFTATPAGKLDYVNPQWVEYTGKKYVQLINHQWTELIHPDDREDTEKRWEYSLETGEPFTTEQRFRRHDGEYRWHLSRARAMKDETGKVIRWFGSNTDVDDLRSSLKREHGLEKRALKLTEQRAQLIALNKAKDEFIALASHQLRTPATAVKQFLGLVLEGYVGDISAEQRTMLGKANLSNERQIHIINDLLEVARIDAGKITLEKRNASIVRVVRQAVEELTSIVSDRKQQVIVVAPRTRCLAFVDETKIRMVFENIISNASKYSVEDTTIRIRIEKSGNTIRIAIADEGVGINKVEMKKLFKKFSRIDNPLSVLVGGSGLGLYWAERIVFMHSGRIEVESEPRIGSTFTVVLPAVMAD